MGLLATPNMAVLDQLTVNNPLPRKLGSPRQQKNGVLIVEKDRQISSPTTLRQVQTDENDGLSSDNEVQKLMAPTLL